MAYYHALGGFQNEVNEDTLFEYPIKFFPSFLYSLTEPVSFYRMFHILKDGEIKCKNRLKPFIDNYDVTIYDQDYVYIGKPEPFADQTYDIAFDDFAGYSISLKISDEIEDNPNFELGNPHLTLSGSGVDVIGEYIVKDGISLSYVDAICIPLYSDSVIRVMEFNRNNTRVPIDNWSLFMKKQHEINLIRKMLSFTKREIPIIETFTGEELIDLTSIIEELKEVGIDYLPEYVKEKQMTIFYE